jgi:Domain of unknown function (DUF4145)
MILECHFCEAMVDAKEIAQYEYYLQYEPGSTVPWNTRVTLVKCPICDGPMLACQDDSDPCVVGWGNPVRIYPEMDRQFSTSVPKSIREAFTEARTCFRAKAFTAAAIMCRKTLEGICLVHGVKSSDSLAAQLNKLKDNGTIEKSLFEWAEALRTMGNEAAHGVGSVISPEDARDTLEFTEALIEYIFTYRDKFEEFKKRRATAKSPAKEDPAQQSRHRSTCEVITRPPAV